MKLNSQISNLAAMCQGNSAYKKPRTGVNSLMQLNVSEVMVSSSVDPMLAGITANVVMRAAVVRILLIIVIFVVLACLLLLELEKKYKEFISFKSLFVLLFLPEQPSI